MKKGYEIIRKETKYSGLNCKFIATRTVQTPNNLLFDTINAVDNHGHHYHFRITQIRIKDGETLFREERAATYFKAPEINRIPELFNNSIGLLSADCAQTCNDFIELKRCIYRLDEKIADFIKEEA